MLLAGAAGAKAHGNVPTLHYGRSLIHGFLPPFPGMLARCGASGIACVRALVVALSGLCIKDLIKVDVLCPAEPAFAAGKVLLLEGIVLKGKRDHIGVGGTA